MLSLIHILAYTLIQTFGISIFSLSLKRIGVLQNVYRIKIFIFLLMVNLAGTMTFGEETWQNTSRPVAAGIFLIGMLFFSFCHVALWLKWAKRKWLN